MEVGLLNKFGTAKACDLLPKRNKSDSKLSGGRSLIIAGSEGMFGAGVLAASGAARVGSGYVILMTDLKNFCATKSPDFLTADWKNNKIKDLHFSAIGIGPGLGQSAQAMKLIRQVLKLKVKSVVLDADAFNICSQKKLYPLPKTWIVTPHEGEMARLLKVKPEVIKKNRLESIKLAQKKLKCIILLKGYKTLVSTGKNIYIIQSGNKSLAKAGTGDVLTGIITGFLAQGVSSKNAACLGAFIHGKIADDWIRNKNDYLSLMASDLLTKLPKVLYQLRSKKYSKN